MKRNEHFEILLFTILCELNTLILKESLKSPNNEKTYTLTYSTRYTARYVLIRNTYVNSNNDCDIWEGNINETPHVHLSEYKTTALLRVVEASFVLKC